jgi:hypothetical protein
MGERLNKALEGMEARQQIMNTQMGAFVEQIRSLVSESQSESSRKLQEVLGSVGEQVAGTWPSYAGRLKRRLSPRANVKNGSREVPVRR